MLDTAETLAVETDIPDDIGGQHASRVRAPMLVEKVDPRKPEPFCLQSDVERQLSGDPDEAAVRAQPGIKLAGVFLQRSRQSPGSGFAVNDRLRVSVNGFGGHALGEHPHAAIENRSTHGTQGQRTLLLALRLVDVIVVPNDLDLHESRDDHYRPCRKKGEQLKKPAMVDVHPASCLTSGSEA